MGKSQRTYLAVDIGASGGRVLAGLFDGHTFSLRELHRFPNGPIHLHDRMYWDLLSLWDHVQRGLRSANHELGAQITSIGVDAWGVDYALLGPCDELLGNPRHYRDARTRGKLNEALEKVPRETIFQESGLQFMEINTLYQLFAMRQTNPRLLDLAEDFLMIPDVFHWLLTGQKINEYTNATTTQLYNSQNHSWSQSLLEAFEIPKHLFRDVTQPGTQIGKLRSELTKEIGLEGAEVIVPGTHDTASAVLAVPATGREPWCYISSGTWSLMGVETAEPIVNDRCLELNFTNEGGVGGTNRLLKNIAGLWLVQECRRIWSLQGHEYSWDELFVKAAEARALQSHINPDDPRFVSPADMPATIRAFCKETGQHVPETQGEVIRCALESLALRYREVLQWLETLTGQKVEVIHVVGGGAQNDLLSQMAADACQCRVVAGPVEATAIGNAMMQAIAIGDIESIQAARMLVGRSYTMRSFEPRSAERWNETFGKYETLKQNGG